jgi:hypothetical protein
MRDGCLTSEGQEMGAIAPAPENGRKKIWGAWSIVPVKNLIFAMQTPHGSDFL